MSPWSSSRLTVIALVQQAAQVAHYFIDLSIHSAIAGVLHHATVLHDFGHNERPHRRTLHTTSHKKGHTHKIVSQFMQPFFPVVSLTSCLAISLLLACPSTAVITGAECRQTGCGGFSGLANSWRTCQPPPAGVSTDEPVNKDQVTNPVPA